MLLRKMCHAVLSLHVNKFYMAKPECADVPLWLCMAWHMLPVSWQLFHIPVPDTACNSQVRNASAQLFSPDGTWSTKTLLTKSGALVTAETSVLAPCCISQCTVITLASTGAKC